MYTMHSQEFAQLVNRQFIDAPGDLHHSVEKSGHFSAQTYTRSQSHVNILQFESSFKEDIHVANFQDFNHISFHFQLKGFSDAKISCFKNALPLNQGQYHVMNCVEPVSNFIFPKQTDYQYTCIGINQLYLRDLLLSFGTVWEQKATLLERQIPFTLSDKPRYFDLRFAQTLRAISHPFVADSLKHAFIDNKIEELILLSLSDALANQHQELKVLNQRDIHLLYDFKHFLDSHFLSSFTLSGLAKQIGMNEFKLKKGFKALFHFTVFGYIHHLRMQHGFHLIQRQEIPLGAIAAIVGYQSDASFVRAFKNYYGYLPIKLKDDL